MLGEASPTATDAIRQEQESPEIRTQRARLSAEGIEQLSRVEGGGQSSSDVGPNSIWSVSDDVTVSRIRIDESSSGGANSSKICQALEIEDEDDLVHELEGKRIEFPERGGYTGIANSGHP